jgi:hypothetical protein
MRSCFAVFSSEWVPWLSVDVDCREKNCLFLIFGADVVFSFYRLLYACRDTCRCS